MILILSKSNHEGSTEDIIDWLKYKGALFKRLNGADFYENLSIKDLSFEINDLDLDQVKVVWYRRWMDEEFFSTITSEMSLRNDHLVSLHINLSRETKVLKQYFDLSLRHVPWVTFPEEIQINKLDVLNKAKKIGIKFPPTLVTTSKKVLEKFKETHLRIISKPISDVVIFNNLDYSTEGHPHSDYYSSKTIEVDSDLIEGLEPNFFPSLFQKLIEKEYEIRCFFLDSIFYAMAIFSQLDSKTSLDFRNYNEEKPNRRVPYILPNWLESKLRLLIKKVGLTTGSIDLIKGNDGEYYLLEINPIGQFGMTSSPCNYYIEEIIADKLIEINEN